MKIAIADLTFKGPRVRNDDYLGSRKLPDDRYAVAIADGVGGRKRGNDAAQYAITRYLDELQSDPSLSQNKLLEDISHSLFLSGTSEEQSRSDMATTFTGGIIGSEEISGVHVGDSRLAVLRKNGIKRLTEDHSEVGRLLKEGRITKEEARDYPRKNILERALGTDDLIEISCFDFNLKSGDRLVFSTDGVHQKVFLREIRDISCESKRADELAQKIMDLVKSRSPDDNASLIVVEFMNSL